MSRPAPPRWTNPAPRTTLAMHCSPGTATRRGTTSKTQLQRASTAGPCKIPGKLCHLLARSCPRGTGLQQRGWSTGAPLDTAGRLEHWAQSRTPRRTRCTTWRLPQSTSPQGSPHMRSHQSTNQRCSRSSKQLPQVQKYQGVCKLCTWWSRQAQRSLRGTGLGRWPCWRTGALRGTGCRPRLALWSSTPWRTRSAPCWCRNFRRYRSNMQRRLRLSSWEQCRFQGNWCFQRLRMSRQGTGPGRWPCWRTETRRGTGCRP